MKKYTAEYKKPTGELINIEFEHDFNSDSQHFEGRNVATGEVHQFLYVGYLIYSSIVESVLVPA